MVSPWVVLGLIFMGTHRVTRLITRDVFPPIRWVRELIERKLGDEHWLAYLTQCDWCASIYVATAVTTSIALYMEMVMDASPWPWPFWILVGLTASTVTGLIAQKEPE